MQSQLSLGTYFRLILVPFILLLSGRSKANVDSLFQVYQLQATTAGEAFDRVALDSLADLILGLGDTLAHPEYQAYGRFRKAEVLSRVNPELGISIGNRSLSYYTKNSDYSLMARVQRVLGFCYSNMGQHEEGLKFFDLALGTWGDHIGFDTKEGHRFQARTYYNAGFTSMRKGDLAGATTQLIESKKIADKLQDTILLHSILNQMGNVHLLRKQYEEAMISYMESLRLCNLADPNNATFPMLGMAGVYHETGELDSAMYYYNLLESIKKKRNDVSSLCVILFNKADVFRRLDDTTGSLQTSRELLKVAEEANISHFIVHAVNLLSIVNYDIGDLDNASKYLKRALALVDDIEDYDIRLNTYKTAALIYEKKKNYKKALDYERQYKIYSDSITNITSLEKVDQLKIAYETEQKEQKILQLEDQKKISDLNYRQNIIIVSSIGIISSILALLFFSNIKRKQLIAENRVANVERRLLRSQMNPHFIFNTISSIQNYLFERSELKTALDYLSKFAELMRQILENSREEYVPLSEEINTLKNYLELQQLRYSNSFGYEIDVSEDIDINELMVPPLIAQPFVENAIEHGMVYRVENGRVKIRFDNNGDNVSLSIEDNGVGVKSTEIAPVKMDYKKKSLATTITKERLALISKANRDKFEMIINPITSGGTLVTIQLPKILLT